MLQELTRKKGLTVIMSLHELELAERVSDKVLCVKGKYVERFGTPEEIFTPGYIRFLFDIETGSYDEKNSSMELQKPTGEIRTFVIAGGGSGKPVYRKLQREGIPFAAGILYENDLDYPVAYALAEEVIAAEAFEPVSDREFEKAKYRLEQCEQVICCKGAFGQLEQANAKLLAYAVEKKKNISYDLFTTE